MRDIFAVCGTTVGNEYMRRARVLALLRRLRLLAMTSSPWNEASVVVL